MCPQRNGAHDQRANMFSAMFILDTSTHYVHTWKAF